MEKSEDLEDHVARLQAAGLIDMHFDLPLALFLKRPPHGSLAADFLPQFQAGGLGLLGVALYVEDKDLPRSLEVALEQVALLYEELAANPGVTLCRNFAEIAQTQRDRRIGMLLTMEGVEPLGEDLHLLRIFHALGLRALSLTHARPNAAAAGGIFAASGSLATGLTSFGRELVQECERLGILLDLAHINPAGFEEICGLTSKPLIVSHSNPRRFYDIERNLSDAQIKIIGARGGVIGINAIFVSPRKERATLDHYVDHIAHVIELIGIDGVGIGFDFCEAPFTLMPPAEKEALEARLARVHFLPDLRNHSHARNLTRKLIERGFRDDEIEKILRGNWLRVLRQVLNN
ncbi:MAG: dipeptidase [Chthoniobacterales bacterium]